jgi:uncharacterized C2H2 Zn-finger protein
MKINPLLVHPPPEPDDTIASWLERLAKENHMNFGTFLAYIYECSRHLGFLEALHQLTRIHVNIISSMHDEFKENFWEDYKSCPFKDCDYKKDYYYEIVHHLMQTHDLGITWYHCPEPDCDFKAKKKVKLEEHVTKTHDPDATLYICEYCDYYITNRKQNLERHVRRVHEKGKFFFCNLCGLQSRTRKDWFNHLRIDHGIWTFISLDPTRRDDGYHCPYCEEIIQERLELSKHVKNEHGESGKIKCPHCRFVSNSRKEHSKHLRDCHAFGNWFKCNLCGQEGKDKRIFIWHLKNEHDIRML